MPGLYARLIFPESVKPNKNRIVSTPHGQQKSLLSTILLLYRFADSKNLESTIVASFAFFADQSVHQVDFDALLS